MKKYKHLFKEKLKQKKGSVSIEAALVMMLVFPILLGLVVTGYLYTHAQIENSNLNFNTGRYISKNSCSIKTIHEMAQEKEWEGYKIALRLGEIDGEGNDSSEWTVFWGGGTILSDENIKGEIIIQCYPQSHNAEGFKVTSKVNVIRAMGSEIFPDLTTKNAWYIQEAPFIPNDGESK